MDYADLLRAVTLDALQLHFTDVLRSQNDDSGHLLIFRDPSGG
jgi:hypothetical protein